MTTNSPRRHCSKCGEDLGFSESDPCSRCGAASVDERAEAVARQVVNVLNAAYPSIDWPFWTIRNLIAAEFAPRATGETTVEACLAELRMMFPQAEWTEVRLYWDDENGKVYEVEIGDFYPAKDRTVRRKFQHGTLADCMAQVRAAAQKE